MAVNVVHWISVGSLDWEKLEKGELEMKAFFLEVDEVVPNFT